MERRRHILAIPYPAQGHVIPMMKLSQCLVEHGFKITFVNTEYNHERVLNALPEKDYIGDHINLVSIPDGLEPWEDRNEFGRLTQSLFNFVPEKLKELIERIDASEDEKITCILVDSQNGWALEVAETMKICRVLFLPASAALHILLMNVKKLIHDGIIDNNGVPLKNQMIQLGSAMPAMTTKIFEWTWDATPQKLMLDTMLKNYKAEKLADWIICNSSYDLELGAFMSSPKILPIGPLTARSRKGNSGCFWQEDATCLEWLDQQPPKSVIYVAFGSIAIFDKTQFQELALGLELTGRKFLWVVRPGITKETYAYPEGFEERVANQGKIVEWAPQQKVLSHPSVGCFLSHCGWNSTMEGVTNGIPFLCWPYFTDQFINESYICDIWKVGLKFISDENRIINREEIKTKVEQVLGDENIKARTIELKEIAMKSVAECGHSRKNFLNLVEWLMNI